MSELREGNEMEVKTPHLDDDAFAELSLGAAPDGKMQAHLETCGQCRQELARFQEAMSSFNMASLAWGEEKSEQLSAIRPAARDKTKADASRPSPGMIWVAALLLAIGVAVPAAKMHFSTVHDLEARNAASELDDDPAGLNSPEQIAKDNALMADVNYELSHSRTVLLSQYDRQRGSVAPTGVIETGKRSR